MKTATWIIITLSLIIILGLVYYYYCVCQKKTKEGFSTQSGVNTAYSDRPLYWVTPGEHYGDIGFDSQGGNMVVMDSDSDKKYTVVKGSSYTYTKPSTPTNLYVNEAISINKFSSEQLNNNTEMWEEVTESAQNTDGSTQETPTATQTKVWKQYNIETGDEITGSEKDTSPYSEIGTDVPDGAMTFMWGTDENGKFKTADATKLHFFIYSPKNIFDFDEHFLSEDLLAKSSEAVKPTGWWSSGGDKLIEISQYNNSGFGISTEAEISAEFPLLGPGKTLALADLAKPNYGDANLQKALFSATIDNANYNKSAVLEPIIDTVFFDPLTYNFVQLEHVGGKVNTIVYDIGGKAASYVNEPYSGDIKTIEPWTIVCNKNGVVLFINPKDNMSSANRLRICIFSVSDFQNKKLPILQYTSNVFLLDSSVAIHKEVISQMKEDRSNGIAKPVLLYFKDEDIELEGLDKLRELIKGGSIEIAGEKKDVPTGSYSCLKDEVKYFQFGSHPEDVNRCVIGDYKEYLVEESKKAAGTAGAVAAGDVVPDGGKTEGYELNLKDVPKEHLDDYYKWMWYWKSKKYEEHNGLRDMSDYILKSSVVPPVCPTCPSCPSTGVCTECGGKGGSGTKGVDAEGNEVVGNDTDGDGIIDDVFGGINKVVTGAIDTTGNAASQLTDAAGNVVSKVGEQVGSAASAIGEGGESAIGKAYGAGKTAVSDAYGAGKTAVSDTYGAGKRTVGDIYQEAKNVGGDVTETVGDAADATGIPEYLGGEMDNALIAQDNRRQRLQNEGQAIQQQAYAQQFGGSYGRPMPGSITSGTPTSMVYGGSNMGSGVNTYVGVGGQQRVVNPSVSNMNYMGRLPAKGNDKYVPITSDFSSFGR